MRVSAPKTHNFNPTFQGVPPRFQKVDNFLIRGPRPSLSDLIELKKEGVNQIYDFRHKSMRSWNLVEKVACWFMNIKYKRKAYSNLGEYPQVVDFENIAQSVAQNGESGGKTLFHCNSGLHRTAHMAAFYRLTKGKASLDVTKQKLGEKYKETATSILKSEVVHKGYYSRKFDKYTGKNPIKHFLASMNNYYVKAIKRGQELFYKNILGLNNPQHH